METSIREYLEELPVIIDEKHGRLVVIATNEAGFNKTQVDLEDILDWVAGHRPDLLISRE